MQRLIIGKVINSVTDVSRPGILVQQVVRDEDDCNPKWETVCPLTDAHFMLDFCPRRWHVASVNLRDMIERGEPVTLEIERAALTH